MQRSLVVIVAGFALLIAGSALAQTADLSQPDTSMQSLLDLIVNASTAWSAALKGYALNLLFLLAGIQFIWTLAPLVLKQADLGDIVHELIKFVMVVGFFMALIQFAPGWAQAIIDSFREAGAHASGMAKELMPGDMFATAVEFSDKISDGMSVFEPGTSLLIAVSAIVVLLCFAFIAAFMFVTLVEAYVIINGGVLFYGFGGSQWTREFATAPLRYAVAAGAKLFVLTLIVGLIMSVSEDWMAAYKDDQASVLTLVGLSLVCAYLAKTIPELIGGMISGTSMGGGAAIGSMATTAVAAAAGAGLGGMVAAGGAGSAGSGAAGATGGNAGGGLANSLNASMAGGQTAEGAMSSGADSSVSGTGSGSSAVAPRIGGSASSSPNGASPSVANRSSGGIIQPAKAPQSGGGASSPSSSAPNRNKQPQGQTVQKAANVAGGAARVTGALAALSVPGMEGASSIGGGQPPQMPELDDDNIGYPEDASTIYVTNESNTIRPAPEEDADERPTPNLSSLHVPGLETPGKLNKGDHI